MYEGGGGGAAECIYMMLPYLLGRLYVSGGVGLGGCTTPLYIACVKVYVQRENIFKREKKMPLKMYTLFANADNVPFQLCWLCCKLI